jgi:hypothetical protein
MPIRKIDVVDFSTCEGRIQHGLGFDQRRCQRFLTQDVLAVSKGGYGLVSMESIWSDYRHCVKIGLRTEFSVVRVYSRDTELTGYGVRMVRIPTTDGYDFSLWIAV